jgi:hypothetical protein
VTSTRIVLADYLGRPRMLLTVRVPPACDVNGVFAAMHSPGRTEFLHGRAIRKCAIVPGDDASQTFANSLRAEEPKTPHTIVLREEDGTYADIYHPPVGALTNTTALRVCG